MKKFVCILLIGLLNLPCFAFSVMQGLSDRDNNPENFEECNAYLDKRFKEKDKSFIKEMPYNDLIKLHFSLGQDLKNKWLEENRNPVLIKFLEALDLHTANDMAFVIIKSYWHHLNNLHFDAVKEIKAMKASQFKPATTSDSIKTPGTK